MMAVFCFFCYFFVFQFWTKLSFHRRFQTIIKNEICQFITFGFLLIWKCSEIKKSSSFEVFKENGKMHDLLVVPVRDKDYYDNLLKELDERYASPYTSAVKVIPPLELRKALHSRGFSRGSTTTRPNTSHSLTSTRPNTARSFGDPLERETRRFEFLCERDAKQTFKSPRPDTIIEKLRGPQLIGKELYVSFLLVCKQTYFV
jgi:hypothetical protein